MKKFISLILCLVMICCVISIPASADAYNSINLSETFSTPNLIISLPKSANIIKNDSQSNTIYYLDSNTLYRVKYDESNSQKKIERNGLYQVKSCDSSFEFYCLELTPQEVSNIFTDSSLRESLLTKSDQATDCVGAVQATLSVKYSNEGDQGYHLHSATGSAKAIHNEGVNPQTSQLEWTITGQRYYLGSEAGRGVYGDTIEFSQPGFSNYRMMTEGESVVPWSDSGVTYTCYCTRGVSVSVQIPFH
ncbi:hypothetical protein [Anaeromassilibacillus sp. SJQ-1]|uniref:hypothetical protein n=1 Tax=Anaeromassilibacillus sp. SJQ-1 TaxID=3375419 RepID=UPI00398A4B46